MVPQNVSRHRTIKENPLTTVNATLHWILLMIFGAVLIHTLYRTVRVSPTDARTAYLRVTRPRRYWALQALMVALLVLALLTLSDDLRHGRAGGNFIAPYEHWLGLFALTLVTPWTIYRAFRAVACGEFASANPDRVVLRRDQPTRFWFRVIGLCVVTAICLVALGKTLHRLGLA